MKTLTPLPTVTSGQRVSHADPGCRSEHMKSVNHHGVPAPEVHRKPTKIVTKTAIKIVTATDTMMHTNGTVTALSNVKRVAIGRLYLLMNLLTWNATGVMSSGAYLSQALNTYCIDIAGISEHWLYKNDEYVLSHINSGYSYYSVSDSDLTLPRTRRVGKGGVAFLWRKQLDQHITCLDVDDDRIIGIEYKVNTELSMYIFQVYFPCSTHSVNIYREYVDKIVDLYNLYSNSGIVIFMGDFNGHLNSRRFHKSADTRSMCLEKFLLDYNMVAVNALDLCTGAHTSFVSYSGTHESLIDHIMIPSWILTSVASCSILDDNAINVSNHRPVVCSLSLIINTFRPNCTFERERYNWKRVSASIQTNYQNIISHNIGDLVSSEDVVTNADVDRLYNDIVNTLHKASSILPKSQFKPCLKPYWDKELKSLHKLMRIKRNIWVSEGRPRGEGHRSYSEYKQCKCDFRRIQRGKVNIFLNERNQEVDEAAEIDSTYFWKLVNRRRKPKASSNGNGIKFDNVVCTNPEVIVQQWGNYFQALYMPTCLESYDANFEGEVNDTMNRIKSELVFQNTPSNTRISIDEVNTALKSCKRNKACGPDGIYYEHILYGGDRVSVAMSQLFTAMLSSSHTPPGLKKGIIITLHKGGKKRKDDPNNYRAITLSSCIIKVYERILLKKIQTSGNVSLCSLQGGFQKGMSCILTSYLLHESIAYAKENSSKLYVCFLDAKKAFDKVWHAGLFYKMYNMGVDRSILRSVMEMYDGMTSCVQYMGYRSPWFPVLQGTRQGGVISPFLYLLFIDGLIKQLDRTTSNFNICGYRSPCPTVADDMVLVALSKAKLDDMLTQCYFYSCKWRYEYNASKCSVVVFNESRHPFRRSNRVWFLGNEPLSETESYTHLGVTLNKYCSNKDQVSQVCSKIKSTYLYLVNSGIQADRLHPFTSNKVYKSIVLPKALYGSEMLFNLSKTDILTMEKCHRFCIKFMQRLPSRTRTAVALGMIGQLSLISEIDRRKLVLLGQICLLPTCYRVKWIFNARLLSYVNCPTNQVGFVPEVILLLCKYDLMSVMDSYLKSGIFASKYEWKRLVKCGISKAEAKLRDELVNDPVRRFYDINPVACDRHNSSVVWEICRLDPSITDACFTVAYLTAALFYTQQFFCTVCDREYANMVEHVLCECPCNIHVRDEFFVLILEKFGHRLHTYMFDISTYTRVNIFLGAITDDLIANLEPEGLFQFHKTCFTMVKRMWLEYNMLTCTTG